MSIMVECFRGGFMNITAIKTKAKHILSNTNSSQYKKIIIMILIMSRIPNIYQGTSASLGLLSFVLGILFICLTHGYVVSGLKVVNGHIQALNDEDSFVGVTRFKELIPTYLVSNLFIYGVSILIFIVLTVICSVFIGTSDYFVDVFSNTVIDETMITQLLTEAPSFMIMIAVLILILAASLFVTSALAFAMPYLLEKHNITGFKCLKQSINMMKHHIFDYIKLELSFLGWIILIALIEELLITYLSFLPFVLMIVVCISSILSVQLYYPVYVTSLAIFFEELAYEHNREGVEVHEI